jgi:tRNA-specific 2-thiouridylase
MPIHAIGLISGGLDSILALRLMLDQGLGIEAMHVVLPVHDPGLRAWVERVTAQMGVPLHVVDAESEFLAIVRRPRHGYGSGLNPCLDCRVLMLRKAAARMREVGASFVFTGEVLDERPMSQHQQGLDLVERKAGLVGRLLRPLSAQLLPPTIPEQEGLVDRSRLLGLSGRRRLAQIALAEQYGIAEYPPPAGGCFLTKADSARRLRAVMENRPNFSSSDFYLVRLGRHLRLSPRTRVVVGRDKGENARIAALAEEGDLLFEVPNTGSPVTLLRGEVNEETVRQAAAITARYSDARTPRVVVRYGDVYPELALQIEVDPISRENLEPLRI